MAHKYKYPETLQQINENQWRETDEEAHWEQLCCLPPERGGGGFFLVGEPLSHLNTGEEVFSCHIEVDGRYFEKPLTIALFDRAAVEREVRQQFNLI